MTTFPNDEAARRRLLAAQRAESQALRAVMAVTRKKHGAEERLKAVDAELAETQAMLVAISGLSRAAQLLEVGERELKQRVKHTG